MYSRFSSVFFSILNLFQRSSLLTDFFYFSFVLFNITLFCIHCLFLYSSTLFEYLVCFQYDSFTICFFQCHLLFSIYFPSPLFLNLTFNRFLFLFFSFIILFLTSLFQDNFFHLFLFQYYTILPPSLLSAFLFSFVFFSISYSPVTYLFLSLSYSRPSTLSIYSSFTLLSDRADKTDRSRMRRKKQNGSVARRAYDLFRREPPTRNIWYP